MTPRGTPNPCPYCTYRANTVRDEIRHMESAHPDVIDERLTRAGFVRIDDRWVDTLADPND